MDEVAKVVRDYVIREYLEEGDDREITETTPLISGGIVDSFSMVSLKRFLERKYNDTDSRRLRDAGRIRYRAEHRRVGAPDPETRDR